MPEGQRILALDIASACGYAFGAGGQVLKYGKFASDTADTEGEKLYKFSKWISSAIHDLPAPPDIVVIEQPYFLRNAHTFAVLNKFVAIAQREVYRLFQIECDFMTAKDVKIKLGLPKAKTHAQRKVAMVRKINSLLGTNFQYVANRNRKFKRSDDDIADAIGLLIAWWIKHDLWTA